MKPMYSIAAVGLVLTGPVHASEAKSLRYGAFMDEFRQSLISQGVQINDYRKDIEIISNLAAQCPSAMPKLGFRPRMGSLKGVGPYFSTPASRTCEVDGIKAGGQAFIPNPLVSGSEPRKLYLWGVAQNKAVTPGSDVAAYEMTVYIEPKDRSARCVEPWSWNDILYRCMQLILDAIIIPESEIAAAKQREEEAEKKQQVTAAAAAAERQRNDELEVVHKRELAGWPTLGNVADGDSTFIPSDSQIISTLNAYLDYKDTDDLWDRKKKVSSINLRECDNDAETGCRTSPNGNGNYKGGLAWYSNRNDCVQRIKQACRAELQRYQSEIDNFKYRTSKYVITVVTKNNYEGNIICYVNIRTKGTDDAEQDKITFQVKNNRLIVKANEVVRNRP